VNIGRRVHCDISYVLTMYLKIFKMYFLIIWKEIQRILQPCFLLERRKEKTPSNNMRMVYNYGKISMVIQ
jgi:hypothetical protein